MPFIGVVGSLLRWVKQGRGLGTEHSSFGMCICCHGIAVVTLTHCCMYVFMHQRKASVAFYHVLFSDTVSSFSPYPDIGIKGEGPRFTLPGRWMMEREERAILWLDSRYCNE